MLPRNVSLLKYSTPPLAKFFTPFISYDQCSCNVYNFAANGGEMGEENVFHCWVAFEPSLKSATSRLPVMQ
jgi:hypothetical protein